MRRIKQWDFTPLFLVAAMLTCWGVLHALLGSSFFGSTPYNTYTLQAMAWRDGSLHLPHDYSYLELAVFEGNYYVSFPPLPSLVLLPLTFIFGYDTPDNLLVKLYALAACLLMYRALRRAEYGRASAALLAFLMCMASSLLPLTLSGAVWYHAQALAFFLMIASIACLCEDKPTPCLLCYALSVACRPFHALYALPLFTAYLWLNHQAGVPLQRTIKRLLPGIAAGVCVAAALAAYNYARFGDVLEFGHNYLPEFSTQGGVQFSAAHILRNAKTFIWGLPIASNGGKWSLQSFGYSAFFACPALLLMLIWFAMDIVKRRVTPVKTSVVLAFLAHFALLLTHRTFGGYQLGARYCVDLIPYAFFYLMLRSDKRRIHPAEAALLIAVFLFTCYGVTQIHI